MLGADTRSTNGDTVADKNCEKIHFIAPNIYCCGAGTAADTMNVTGDCMQPQPRSFVRYFASCSELRGALTTLLPPAAMVSSHLELHRYAVSRQSRVITVRRFELPAARRPPRSSVMEECLFARLALILWTC